MREAAARGIGGVGGDGAGGGRGRPALVHRRGPRFFRPGPGGGGRVVVLVVNGRVLLFFGEALRQAGILIVSSTIVIWGLVFITGLECGIEGAYLLRAQGAPPYAGVFAAWCDLRELVPYAFGYM